MNGVLDYLDTEAEKSVAREGDSLRQTIAADVVEAINREFEASVLRSPNEADRRGITERIRSLVASGYRRRGQPLSLLEESEIASEIARRMLGLGFLDSLLPPSRTDLSEIALYSSGLLQVMPKGRVRWQTVDAQLEPGEVWRTLDVLLGQQARALNEATPSVNAKLPATQHNPGGGRVKALHPIIAPPGRFPAVNIRLFEQQPVLPDWLLERGLMAPEMMALLKTAIQSGRRILIAGGTRTGKTTLLSALCNYLPQGWRIVKIEDPEEIWIDRPTVQTIEARPALPGSEILPYTLADGVDDALRMSPDYLIVGEVRDGRAAMSLFRALMTGHAGACTFHSDTPREAIRRLATVMGADMGIRAREAHQTMADSLDLIVQLGIHHEVRRVMSIVRINRELKGGDVTFDVVWRCDETAPPTAPAWTQVREMKE